MSQVTETICDVCGARQNKSTNGWFHSVLGEDQVFHISMLELSSDPKYKSDLCSLSCAIKSMSKYLQPDKVEAPNG